MTKNPNTERALRLGNNRPARTLGRISGGVPDWKMKERLPTTEVSSHQSDLSGEKFLVILTILIFIGTTGYLMFGRKKVNN